MAPAVPEEKNTGRQLATCSPRRDCDGGMWHCVSQRRAECSAGFRTLFITARKTSKRLQQSSRKASLCKYHYFSSFWSETPSPLHLFFCARSPPGHNITGHDCCFDINYIREKNRRDELTQAQGLIQEQERKKGKKSPSPSPSKGANQGSG